VLEIKEKSITVTIDTSKCDTCETKACAAACKKYARGFLQIVDGKPSVAHLSADEVLRLGTECLACEFACTFDGNKAITIDVPIEGLPEYLAKRGLA
jgi:Fe-S-cluster-containing dehydrogenase component